MELLNPKGKAIGKTCSKTKVHRLGYWHRCVHIWIYSSANQILIQKRAINKSAFPNFWDVSVAGHVIAGETLEEAAKREVFEELGLNINQKKLQKIGTYAFDFEHSKNYLDREHTTIFIYQYQSSSWEGLKLQSEEVSEIRLVGIKELSKHVQSDSSELDFVPYHRNYFKFVIDHLGKKISTLGA